MAELVRVKRFAEQAIARILKQLESETGQNVEAISLSQWDVTAMRDLSPRLRMGVRIDLVRQPGHDWDER